MRKRSNRLYNGYVGAPAYPQPYCEYTGVVTTHKQYLSTVEVDVWKKPDYWLSLPNMVQGDQKFAGLFAVFNGAPNGNTGFSGDSNFVALSCKGNYIVDWGDGVTAAYASGVKAQYRYNFNNISASTETPEGYRQVIIQAYPQAGATLTELDLQQLWSSTGTTYGQSSSVVAGWLDIRMAAPYLTYLRIGNGSGVRVHYMGLLQQFHYVGSSSLTSTSSVLRDCYALQRVIGTEWTANITDFGFFFGNCNAIRTLPLLDTRKATNMIYAFIDCWNLEKFPPIDTSNVTTFQQMLQDQSGRGMVLRYMPMLNTAKVKSFQSTFQRCRCLRSLPTFDTSSATEMNVMFSQCYALQEVPPFNTSNVTLMNNFVEATYRLRKFPLLDTSKVTNFTNFFSGSFIESIPDLNTSSGTNFTSMFNSAYALKKIPNIDTSKGITFNTMFRRNYSAQTIPTINLSGASAGPTGAASGPLYNIIDADSANFRWLGFTGMSKSINLANLTLSPTALDNIYNGLANVTGTGATITITNNWGATASTTSIATGKGWTVVN